jgi:hypothetical protein
MASCCSCATASAYSEALSCCCSAACRISSLRPHRLVG